MGPTSCSMWVERHLTSYSMAYIVLPINAAGDWRGMHLRGCLRCRCRHSWMLMWHPLTWLTLSCPPPSLHPASSSSHLLLDLLFLCPVVVGVRDGCRHAVDVAGVDMAASTCHGWNQRVLVDLDAMCGWCGGGWHGSIDVSWSKSTCSGGSRCDVACSRCGVWCVVDVAGVNVACSRLMEHGCECPHPSTRGEGKRDSGCGGNVKKWIFTQVTRVMISHTSLN